MIVGSGQDLLSKLESQRTVKVLITLKVRLNLFILSSWVYFVTYFLYCAVEHCALMNKRVTSSAIIFFFCIKILNISSVNDYSIGSTVPNWILVTIVLMCPVLCDCCLTALRWFSSSDAVCFFCSRGSLVILRWRKKKSFLYGHLEVLMGGAGGEVTVAAKILATSEISTFLVFKQGAFYHSNGYSCTLFNTGTQKSVVDAWGPLLDHIFFLFPTPTHTHTLSSAV